MRCHQEFGLRYHPASDREPSFRSERYRLRFSRSRTLLVSFARRRSASERFRMPGPAKLFNQSWPRQSDNRLSRQRSCLSSFEPIFLHPSRFSDAKWLCGPRRRHSCHERGRTVSSGHRLQQQRGQRRMGRCHQPRKRVGVHHRRQLLCG